MFQGSTQWPCISVILLRIRFRNSGAAQKDKNSTFIEDIESLWIDMYERGFVEESDVENIQGNKSLLNNSVNHEIIFLNLK